MPLSRDEERLLSQLHKNLRQEALEPDDPLWINFREDRFDGSVGPDSIRQLARDVSWVEPPSVAFFSGFRGAGKSTELNRLRNVLRDDGFAVAKFDVEEYLDLRIPITAGQLVFAMTAGIWRSCQEQGWVGEGDDPRSPFKRLWEWFRSVHVEADVNFSVPLPSWSPADFQAHLHRDPTFREQLGSFLRLRSLELTEKADEFLTDLNDVVRKEFRSRGREWLGMVVIVDSLDHARSETAFSDVRNAIREVFDLQLPLVQFQPFRTVFCIPPYISPAAGTVRRITNIKVADRSGKPWLPGVDALVEVLNRRLPDGLSRKDLVAEDELKKLVCRSGGHIRDLLRVVDEVILGLEKLPATTFDVDAAIVRLRESFPTLSADQKRWLAAIAESHRLELETQDAWEGLAELLDYHLVLTYANDEPWYDVHPAIAELVRPP